MPSPSSDPEKYSIDEMMDRLKSTPTGNPDEGELVIREDGTQAIRVRKRKRRTEQPAKRERQSSNRMRVAQISATLILLFLFALLVGGAIVFANSSPFREGLLRKIEQASGGKVDLLQFRMNPKTALAYELNLKWPAGNVLDTLVLRNLTAEIFPSSFLGKAMKGEEVSAAEAILKLRYPEPGESTRSFPPADGIGPVRFNRYRTPSLSLTLGDPKAPALTLSKSEGSLNPETVNGSSQLSFYQGEVTLPNWPKLRLDRALVEFSGEEANVVGLRLLHQTDSRGIFELSGIVHPYQPTRTSSLQILLQFFELEGITGPAISRLITGRIDTMPATKSNTLSFLPTEDSVPSLEATFQVSPTSQIELRGFPFLLSLAQTLDDPWFRAPVFDTEARGILRRENGVVTFRDLKLESKGRLAVRGEFSVTADQELSGRLEIGVAEAMIASSKINRLKAMFGPSREGFRWISLIIGGPVVTPSDNFKEIFSATSTAAPDTAAPGEPESSTFEQLTRPK
ncbi:MAG: hypothetical protein ACRDBP_06735 [Luteolibacter sp.]